MKRLLFIIIFFIFNSSILISQNLLRNGDFEQIKKQTSDNVNKLRYCYSPNKATPDILNPYIRGDYGNPKNGFGYQKPHSDKLYVGINNYNEKEYHHEFITLDLIEKLKKDSLYKISMYVSLANLSNYACDGLGVLLTDYKIKWNNNYLKMSPPLFSKPIIPTIQNVGGEIITDTMNWVLICDTIRAKGGEMYITIGNFKTDNETNIIQIHNKKNKSWETKGTYYYIDDVSLEPIQAKEYTPCKTIQYFSQIAKAPILQQTQIPIILENVNFESGKSDILKDSYTYLDSLVLYISKEDFKIQIIGYTDNVGNAKTNQILSENRAKAIVEYLISKGISSTRLVAKGYGSAKPLVSNDTEEGRAKNRRVEFIVLKN